MYGVADDPTDHKKCYLFKTCDELEPCDDCTTGEKISIISKPLGTSYLSKRQTVIDNMQF